MLYGLICLFAYSYSYRVYEMNVISELTCVPWSVYAMPCHTTNINSIPCMVEVIPRLEVKNQPKTIERIEQPNEMPPECLENSSIMGFCWGGFYIYSFWLKAIELERCALSALALLPEHTHSLCHFIRKLCMRYASKSMVRTLDGTAKSPDFGDDSFQITSLCLYCYI